MCHLVWKLTVFVCICYQVSLFGYKAKVTQDQFFKYGYAEMKMLMCCDVISLVRRKQKYLKMQRSLSAKRVMHSRSQSNDNGRFTLLSHKKGSQSNYYFERDVHSKNTRVGPLSKDLTAGKSGHKRSMSQRKTQKFSSESQSLRRRDLNRQPEDQHERRNESNSSQRCRSLEAYERLTGSVAFKPANRHRKGRFGPDGEEYSDKDRPVWTSAYYQSALRHREAKNLVTTIPNQERPATSALYQERGQMSSAQDSTLAKGPFLADRAEDRVEISHAAIAT